MRFIFLALGFHTIVMGKSAPVSYATLASMLIAAGFSSIL
jgi:hypothetical protein